MTHRLAFAGAALLVVAGIACDGEDPFAPRWFSNPDTVLLYSMARPELNLHSAQDLVNRRSVRIGAAVASWDVALDTEGDGLVLLPPAALGVDSEAGIAVFDDAGFDDVEEAPSDSTAYSVDRSVGVKLNTVYVVRTRIASIGLSVQCTRYAKLEPLSIDTRTQTLTFVYDTNPTCDDRNLVAEEIEEDD